MNLKTKYNEKDTGLIYLLALAVTLGYQLIATLVVTLLAAKEGIDPETYLSRPVVLIVFYCLNAVLLVALFFIYNKVKKQKIQTSAKTEFCFGFKNLLLCIAISIFVLFGYNYIINLISHIMSVCGYNPDSSLPLPFNNIGWLFANIAILALLPAISEELIYRGIILNGLRRFGAIKAVFFSALIFAFAHGSLMQFFYQLILGIVLGFVLVKTGSLIASMVVHFLNNLIVVVLNYLSFVYSWPELEILNGPAVWGAFDVVIAISMALATTAVVMLLISLLKPKKPELEYTKSKEKFDGTAKVLIIVAAIISLIIWCVGTFMWVWNMSKRSFLGINLIYFVMLSLFVVIRILSNLKLLSFFGEQTSYIVNFVIQIGIMFLIPVIFTTKIKKQTYSKTFEQFGYKTISLKEVLISIALGLIVFVFNIFISSLFSFIFALFGYSAGSGSSSVAADANILTLIVNLLFVAILPAICEETAHRGMLLSTFKPLGFKNAILFSSLFFALLHLNINQFPLAFLIGLLLSIVTLFSRSIIPAMIIHFLNNGINVYLEYASVKNLFLGNFNSIVNNLFFSGNLFTNFVFILVTICLLCYLVLYLLKTLLKINAERSMTGYLNSLAIQQLRRETLGEISDTKNQFPNLSDLLKNKNQPVKVEIPYEALGFYMTPVTRLTNLEKTFFYSTLILSGMITLFTFIWGII